MKIGICTGGGDCPGLNAAIRSIVLHANHTYKTECVGILDSFNGLMGDTPRTMPLGLKEVNEIQNRGGTIIGTFNRGSMFDRDDGEQYIQKTIQGLKKTGVDALIVIGGEGTQGMSRRLIERQVPIVGIPKTIDNDLPETDQTIGFATCVEFVAESVMRLRSTAESHDRIMIVEVMGRDSGFIALHGGLGGGANVILLPEIPFSYPAIVQKITERRAQGEKCSLVVISEGATPEGGQQLFGGQNTGVKNLGGIGSQVATKLFEMTGLDTRYSVLGHLQRGGSPIAYDKILATKYAYHAVDLVMKKKFHQMVVMQNGKITHIPFSQLPGGRKKISPQDPLLLAAKAEGICLG